MTPTLLPSGLQDVLPPQAAAEYRLIHSFLKSFMGFGYQPVNPPLAEFAESILAGQGEATSHHVFRVADPLSTQMLGIRADITGQVARIAGGALARSPRPLRLCYAGYTLRTTAEALKTRRQHTQVGIERFGDAGTNAIAEVLAIAAHALEVGGITGLTIDLHYPSVLEALLKHYPAAQHAPLRDAVRLKDHARLHALGALDIAEMLRHTGAADTVLAKLAAHVPPPIGGRLGGNRDDTQALPNAGPHPSSPLKGEACLTAAIAELSAIVNALKQQIPNITLTIDLLDLSGYGYYHGIGYALFWNKAGLEVGRGGCYRTASGEEAVGFTLYINELLDHLPAEAAPAIQTIPHGTPAREAAKLQAQGFTTVFGA